MYKKNKRPEVVGALWFACGFVLFLYKALGVEVDVVHTFDSWVVHCGTSEVALLFGGCDAVTGVVNDKAPVLCVLCYAGVVGEEFAVNGGHTAGSAVEVAVANETFDKVLISHFDYVLIGLTFILFVFCFSTMQR